MVKLLVLGLAVAVPASNESTAETLLRAVSYDRNLEAKTPEGLRLGVAFAPERNDTRISAERFATDANALVASGSELAPAWVELVPVESETQLYRWSRRHHVSVLFVPTGMGDTLPELLRAAEAAGVLTLAEVPEDVAGGLVLGVRVGEGSKKLVVNMGAAERAGVDFDAVVRQVAERVGDAPTKTGRRKLEETLLRYREAIEERNLGALRTVWPALQGDDEKRIMASFKMAHSHKVAFAVLRIDDEGQIVRARVRRADKLVTKDGETLIAGTLIEVSFAKSGDGSWLIDSMATASPPS